MPKNKAIYYKNSTKCRIKLFQEVCCIAERLELVEVRRLRGFSQEYMAEKLSIHRNTYVSIEKNPEECSIKLAKEI